VVVVVLDVGGVVLGGASLVVVVVLTAIVSGIVAVPFAPPEHAARTRLIAIAAVSALLADIAFSFPYRPPWVADRSHIMAHPRTFTPPLLITLSCFMARPWS
jgi:hypothetical protein